MYGPLTDEKGELVVVSREDAAAQGRSFFYTGKPCKKRGHFSVRYVSNGCCKACLNQTFKAKINPWTNKLVPFVSSKLWTLADFTREERVTLRVYLQHCIFEYIKSQRASRDLNYKAELQAAIDDIEERGKFAVGDPRNQD